MKLIIYICIFLIYLSSLQITSAECSPSIIGNSIYINNCKNITDTYNNINNSYALNYLSNNEWLLNANLINNKTDNVFYINESDIAWLKINSTEPACYYIQSNGILELNNTKITSWNTTTNNTEAKKNRNICRSYIYSKGASSKIYARNSNISFLGYWKYNWYMGLTVNEGNSSILENNTFVGNYRGPVIYNNINSNIINNRIITTLQYEETSAGAEEVSGVFIYAGSGHNIKNNSIYIHDQHLSVNERNIGIWVWYSDNNIIENNSILSEGQGYGIYNVNTANNNKYIKNNILFTNNTGTIMGIYILTNSIFNTFINNDVVTNSSYSRDIYLISTNASNSFIGLNFTQPRKIWWNDAISYFNYNNITDDIWLNTTINSAGGTTRSLLNWTQSNISWREKLTASRTLNYSVSGLIPDTNYSIYTDSYLYQIKMTDSNGKVQFIVNFTINTNKTIEIKT